MKVATVIAAALCAALLASSARADAPPSLWQGAGVFVDNPLNFPGPWTLALTLEANHFTWVAFHVHNGLPQVDLDPMWVDVFREHGISVGAWGTEESHPLIDAVLADQAIRRYGFDFYIADAEGPYLATHHGWKNSVTFVQEFRSLQPTLPAALTTYGAAEGKFLLPIDYAAWRNGGFDLLPQAYYNQFPKVYRPDRTVSHSLRVGWPLARVHPVIGVYRHYPAGRYVPLLQAAGATGFSVFLADAMSASDYAALQPVVVSAHG